MSWLNERSQTRVHHRLPNLGAIVQPDLIAEAKGMSYSSRIDCLM